MGRRQGIVGGLSKTVGVLMAMREGQDAGQAALLEFRASNRKGLIVAAKGMKSETVYAFFPEPRALRRRRTRKQVKHVSMSDSWS